jgi:TRAP-type C4-dicarboxylate transport system permease large subunit
MSRSVCGWVGKQRNFPRETRKIKWPRFRRELLYSTPALLMPVLIISFLRFGFATPTEVSVFSTLMAGLVSARCAP